MAVQASFFVESPITTAMFGASMLWSASFFQTCLRNCRASFAFTPAVTSHWQNTSSTARILRTSQHMEIRSCHVGRQINCSNGLSCIALARRGIAS